MLTNAQLRTQRLAELNALKGTNLTTTQATEIDQLIADITAEGLQPDAATMLQTDSEAYDLPYGLRTALESIPATTSALTASGTHNVAGFSYQIVGTNQPESYQAAPLPAGLTLDPVTGIISGTPTTAGTTNTVINATNSGGKSPDRTLVITIS